MFLIISIAMKYSVVTTFNETGYKQYGQRMVQTFLDHWPESVDLHVYTEQCAVDEFATNLFVHDLEQASPELVAFKKQWQAVPKANGDVSGDPVRNRRKDAGKGFKWDAVRFSHKVYAVFHAAKNCNADWLIWMDADMVCHGSINIHNLNRFCPTDKDLCYLGRKKKFSECGLYAMNLRSVATANFLEKFQWMYDYAELGIFTLDEWHDSFVFDAVRKNVVLNELDWSAELIVGEGHPLINCEWGTYLDHLKGQRKSIGHSKLKDLLVDRKEDYWANLPV